MYYRVGYKHSDETIEKIKNNNGVKGKKPYHKPGLKKHKYFDRDPGGDWVPGFTSDYKKKMSKSLSRKIWCYDPLTLKNIRIDKGEEIPDGYVLGRYLENNKGFDVANSMINVVDLKERRVRKVVEVMSHHAPQSGTSTEKTVVFTFNGFIFTSASSLCNYCLEKGVIIRGTGIKSDLNVLDSYKVPKPLGWIREPKKSFLILNEGKTLSDLGIRYCMLKDFDYEAEECKIWKQI